MIIHQLSVFIENKSGTIEKVLGLLKKFNIQIIASTISDTVDFGIYRIICSNPQKAFKELKEIGVSANLSEVFAVALDDKVGCAADTISLFSRAKINLNYLYSFLLGGKGILIFRSNDAEKAKEIILLNKLETLEDEDLIGMNPSSES